MHKLSEQSTYAAVFIRPLLGFHKDLCHVSLRAQGFYKSSVRTRQVKSSVRTRQGLEKGSKRFNGDCTKTLSEDSLRFL